MNGISYTRRDATDITAYMISLSFAILVIRKSSLFLLKKCPVIDLIDNTHTSIVTLQFSAGTLFGESIEFNYDGNNARQIHHVIT
jgi:hypothetical protein